MGTEKWYLQKEEIGITIWTGERQLKIKLTSNSREVFPGPVKELKLHQSLPKAELKKLYGHKKPKHSDVIIEFGNAVSNATIILDHKLYDSTQRGNLIKGSSVEELIQNFKENKNDKRQAPESPRTPRKILKWDEKVIVYNEMIAESTNEKRLVCGTKDIFKVPIDKIAENDCYTTREKNDDFVEKIRISMLSAEQTLDTIVYVVSDGDCPVGTDGKISPSAKLFILGGTHYLSALKQCFANNTKELEVNAAIFQDLTEEERVWLAGQHNKQQHMCRKVTAKEYIINFRRLLFDGMNIHEEPPKDPPKGWRLKCQGLLPQGKNINSYSPWLSLAKLPASEWALVEKVFSMHESGNLKGMKTGSPLEGHKIWRELIKLKKEDQVNLLNSIIRKIMTIAEAIKEAVDIQGIYAVRETLSNELDISWETVEEKYGTQVSNHALLPFARLDCIENIPAVFSEFISTLRGGKTFKESIWRREDGDVDICLTQGTPFSPPSSNGNVIFIEMTDDDESFGKDELKLIIRKNKNLNQRQLFVVFTSFELIKDVCDSGKEVGISDYDVLLLKVSEGQKAQVTDKHFPHTVSPVVVLKKTSNAVKQTYNFDTNNTVCSNFVNNMKDFLNFLVFPCDVVVDTTLKAEIAQNVNCAELVVTASERDIAIYKEQIAAADVYQEISIGSSQDI